MISNPKSIHTKNWLNGLSRNGIEVTILYVEEWVKYEGMQKSDLDAEVILLNAPNRRSSLVESIRSRNFSAILKDLRYRTTLHQELCILGKRVNKIINKRGFEYIHAHGFAAGALLAAFSNFHPFGVSAWGSDIYLAPKRYPYLRMLIRDYLSKADLIHVESEISAQRVIELTGVDENKLFISTWGVELELYGDKTNLPLVIDGVDLTNKRIILSFRALEPIYQIDRIIKAYSDIYSEFQNVVLVIGSDGSERANLEALVDDLGISDRVVFSGFVQDSQKEILLASSYIYIQCPLSDGVAITVMEAMASGLPIITSNVGENRILVEKGKNGFLIEEPYERNMSDAIRKILLQPQLHDDMANHSRKLAQEKHSRSLFLDKFIKRVTQELSHII